MPAPSISKTGTTLTSLPKYINNNDNNNHRLPSDPDSTTSTTSQSRRSRHRYAASTSIASPESVGKALGQFGIKKVRSLDSLQFSYNGATLVQDSPFGSPRSEDMETDFYLERRPNEILYHSQCFLPFHLISKSTNAESYKLPTGLESLMGLSHKYHHHQPLRRIIQDPQASAPIPSMSHPDSQRRNSLTLPSFSTLLRSIQSQVAFPDPRGDLTSTAVMQSGVDAQPRGREAMIARRDSGVHHSNSARTVPTNTTKTPTKTPRNRNEESSESPTSGLDLLSDAAESRTTKSTQRRSQTTPENTHTPMFWRSTTTQPMFSWHPEAPRIQSAPYKRNVAISKNLTTRLKNVGRVKDVGRVLGGPCTTNSNDEKVDNGNEGQRSTVFTARSIAPAPASDNSGSSGQGQSKFLGIPSRSVKISGQNRKSVTDNILHEARARGPTVRLIATPRLPVFKKNELVGYDAPGRNTHLNTSAKENVKATKFLSPVPRNVVPSRASSSKSRKGSSARNAHVRQDLRRRANQWLDEDEEEEVEVGDFKLMISNSDLVAKSTGVREVVKPQDRSSPLESTKRTATSEPEGEMHSAKQGRWEDSSKGNTGRAES